MEKFIHIRSDRFLPLPGEEEEMVNEGMYGKALALFLREALEKRGYEAPFHCAEDWGWWVELKGFPFAFGVCIYSGDGNAEVMEYALADGAVADRKWSWRKFAFIETRSHAETLIRDLLSIVEDHDGMVLIGVSEAFPIEKS
jgi:hypothetical protein